MATGKSTIGRLVATSLRLPFVDTDDLVAQQGGASVAEVFAREGEARFRDREASIVLPLLSDGIPRVISFGGGTVTIPRVRYAALDAATVVTLSAKPETVIARAASLATRPNLGAASPVDRARDLLALRSDVYAECHAAVATDDATPEEVAAKIVAIAKRDLLAVPLGQRSYAVELVRGQPARLGGILGDLAPSSIFVVTDANVAKARADWSKRALAAGGKVVTIAPGEREKTLSTVSHIWDEALAAGIDRRAVVVALGGGVVGDLAGFAAATLLRGIRCVQVPTTLLSMVDSSVGGKTGFDHATGKNLLGAFFQPSHVLVDIDHLTTLSPRETACGLAEVVKIALVRDADLLDVLERRAPDIARGDPEIVLEVVRRAIHAKIRVVREDERESGPRALLNLGHTVGHALESHAQYTDLLHGEGVAIGTVVEMEACERSGLTPAGLADRARRLLSTFGLPTSAPRATLEAAWPFVLSDKKRSAAALNVPVVLAPGTAEMRRMSLDDFRRALLSA